MPADGKIFFDLTCREYGRVAALISGEDIACERTPHYYLPPYILKVEKFAESAFQSHLREKSLNLYDNILRQRRENHANSKNFVSMGHFC